jgi:hypothetical protein
MLCPGNRRPSESKNNMTSEVREFEKAKDDSEQHEGMGGQDAEMRPSFVSLHSSLPDAILLGALRDRRLRVNSPLTVSVHHEADHLILEALEINEFGFGRNLSDAIVDLQHAIAELYMNLEATQDRLGPDLLVTWGALQKMVTRVHA